MKYPMRYPGMPDFNSAGHLLQEYARLKFECGAERADIERILSGAREAMGGALRALLALPEDRELAAREPDALEDIRRLRPHAPRRLWEAFDRAKYADRLAGAFLGRMAGCTLGAPVEFWSIEAMERWAEYIGDRFPNQRYWSRIKNPNDLHYQKSTAEEFTLEKMDGVPVDDDIAYTLLGLLIAEEHGPDFTVEDVGEAWLKYLPYACTAEDAALRNLKAGIPARKAADVGNPYCQWIGADIRADPWGYIAPGWPEKAAAMAWADASLSHRRNGIYGEMFFSAAIAAAFAMDDPMEALRAGLTEIPCECALHKDVQWALDEAAHIGNYREARAAVDARFDGMSGVHTNNNPTGAMRGFGAAQMAVAYEGMMDRLAAKLGIDRVELRRRNLIGPGDAVTTGQRIPDPTAQQCMQAVLNRAGVGGARDPDLDPHAANSGSPTLPTACPLPPHMKRGWGLSVICFGLGYGDGFPDASRAKVRLADDGLVEVYTGGVEYGQGLLTVMSQIAAEELGVPLAQVRVIWADTQRTHEAGSSSTGSHGR